LSFSIFSEGIGWVDFRRDFLKEDFLGFAVVVFFFPFLTVILLPYLAFVKETLD